MTREPRTVRRIVGAFVLGSFLLQLAWIAAVPPFRGSDEFDHAYRAASVARGYWSAAEAPLGTRHGYLIPVPRDVVEAASPVCHTYRYVGADNCDPGASIGDGLVLEASGAARYQPFYYAVVGAPALGFDGYAALYAMRLATVVLCSALLGLVVWTTLLWARTRWPLLALVIALTPVTLYSFAIPAPNGVEMLAGLMLWTSLIGLDRVRDRPTERRLLTVAALSALPLCVVRTLGPVWFFLIVGIAVLLLGVRRLRGLWSAHRVRSVGVLLTWVSSVALSLVWVVASKPNAAPPLPPSAGELTFPWSLFLQQPILWLLQSVAAFPVRSERAPTLVYSIWVLTGVAFLLFAGRYRDSTRLTRAFVALLILSVLVPVAATLTTMNSLGFAWQGRYTLPLTYGLVLLAGLALDRADVRHRLLGPVIFAGWAALAVAHLVSIAGVQLKELRESPLSGDPAWVTGPTWALVVLGLSGLVLIYLAVAREPVGQTRGVESESALRTADQ